MSVTNTSSFSKLLWPGVNAVYGKAYNEYPVQYTDLFDEFTSRKHYEEDVGVSGFGLAVVKDQGDGVSYDTERQGFTSQYRHITYGLGFIVTREAMEDDLYDVVASRKAQGLAFSMRQTKEVVSANVYNRAFNSSFLGGDGAALLSNAHPNRAGGTWSNILATASDLSEAALEQACIDIGYLKNDRGLQIALMPEKIIISPSEEFNLNRILKSQLRVGTQNNDINALKAMGKFSKGYAVNHFLTDPDAWFIRTSAPHGMKMFLRRKAEFTEDNDFDTENAKYKATERYSVGWTDPRGLYGSPGA
jgi:hypothetical protein